MSNYGDCLHFNGGSMMVGLRSEFTDAEIERARRLVTKLLRCRLYQVDDWDAACYLREQAAIGEKKP